MKKKIKDLNFKEIIKIHNTKMNKYQEALIRLVEGNYLTNREKKQFANILQELVDKETPIKTTSVETEPRAYYGMCDSCGSEIRLCQHYDNEKEKWIKECYCPYCGQKLYFGE